MEQVFSYIIGLGAAVMMPILFTILGVCIGINFGKALKSGLLVGVGFVGLSVVTALLTSSLGEPLKKVTEIYGLELGIFDMGWPAAASVAYNTSVGAFIIPVCLGVNIIMLLTKTTKTVNIDLWNYWHFAFIGAVVYFATENIWWGFFSAIICYIITLIMADLTCKQFQSYYEKMDGISIPQPFCQGFVPFALVINKVLDMIPGFDKLNIDAEGMKRKFGIMGEPLFLGVVVGCGIGALACKNSQELVDGIPAILGLGIKMGAVMELIPRITSLFIEGLRPISDATRELIARKFKNSASLNIGMSPALVIGHPTTLVVSLLLPDWSCIADCRSVFCNRPGSILYTSCSGRICQNKRPGCTDSARIPGRCTRLCFQHLLLADIPRSIQLQDCRFKHTGYRGTGNGYLQPSPHYQRSKTH